MDEATRVETRTTTTVDPTGEADHDGVIPEPGRGWANWLWTLKQLVLGAGLLYLVAILGLLAFTPDAPKGVADPATIVAVIGLVLTAFMQGFTRRAN